MRNPESLQDLSSAPSALLIAIRIEHTRDRREMELHNITPEALHSLLFSNQEVRLFDVRQPLDLLADSEIIVGATRRTIRAYCRYSETDPKALGSGPGTPTLHRFRLFRQPTYIKGVLRPLQKDTLMSYQPIENYGIIGNMRTVALVGMNGSIDWYCYPHFDSPSIFGALLDDVKGGRFQISPIGDPVRYKQFYWPSTNVLITRFLLADGIAELEDFMPVGLPPDSPWYHQLYRRIRCVRGAVRISLTCRPAFDYGRKSHETLLDDQGANFRSGSLCIALSSAVPLTHDGNGGVAAEFTLEEGASQVFILREHCATDTVPDAPTEGEAEELFQTTVRFWRSWLSACTYQGRWREQVYRSALALKLLTFDPTGAIIAAPTTSLPAVIGGTRNWDYRYTWVRDAAFTVYGFLRIGFKDEAAGFINWVEKHAAEHYHPEVPLPAVS